MVDILLTNDDGIKSPGFLALKRELNSLGSLLLVGPSEEKSWISKGISRFDAVKVNKIKLDRSDAFSVQGTPVDATLIGLFAISKELPKLVVSGINLGANIGNAFILSSGTIGAAIEAALIGVPAVAVSLIPPHLDYSYSLIEFSFAAQLTKMIAQRILKYGLPADTDLINLNVPSEANKQTEIIISRIAKLHYGFVLENDTTKNEFIFIKDMAQAQGARYNFEPGTDAYTVFVERKISLTPINIDLTGNLQNLKNWMELEL